jgi:hypothetical protein
VDENPSTTWKGGASLDRELAEAPPFQAVFLALSLLKHFSKTDRFFSGKALSHDANSQPRHARIIPGTGPMFNI